MAQDEPYIVITQSKGSQAGQVRYGGRFFWTAEAVKIQDAKPGDKIRIQLRDNKQPFEAIVEELSDDGRHLHIHVRRLDTNKSQSIQDMNVQRVELLRASATAPASASAFTPRPFPVRKMTQEVLLELRAQFDNPVAVELVVVDSELTNAILQEQKTNPDLPLYITVGSVAVRSDLQTIEIRIIDDPVLVFTFKQHVGKSFGSSDLYDSIREAMFGEAEKEKGWLEPPSSDELRQFVPFPQKARYEIAHFAPWNLHA